VTVQDSSAAADTEALLTLVRRINAPPRHSRGWSSPWDCCCGDSDSDDSDGRCCEIVTRCCSNTYDF
jgi:hypothetical protein